MNNVGLPEWVAEDEHGYQEIATGLAVDIQRLTELRSTMRERMRGSPMMNEGEFAEEIGRAIRGMWREWCEKQGH
jgi:predicted O-linked N-acetylglucosamine transferase (SPINDLY family)